MRQARSKQSQRAPMCGEEAVIGWKKPLPGCVKCNIDASFSHEQNKVGIGLVLRDEFGLFMGAKTLWYQPILDVKTGEAYGLSVAIDWMRELGLEDVIFEMDAKLVVDGIYSTREDATEFGYILCYCREMLSTLGNNSHVEFIRRYANMVAHSLAKVAIYKANPQLYSDIPACIEPLIINDKK